MVADDVEIGVGVAVAGDEPVAGRGYAEGIAHAVGDVFHMCPWSRRDINPPDTMRHGIARRGAM
jgi:hypothetical protein